MELLGSYEANGYTIEAYFPERNDHDIWMFWVVRNGYTVGEFTPRIPALSSGTFAHRFADRRSRWSAME